MKRLWRPEVFVFLGAWATLMVIGRTQLFRDPGTLWHTVSGQRMIATGAVVRIDPFATPPGRPWISMQWLAEIVMAALHSVAQLDTLLLATATLLAALYTWLAHRLLRGGLSPLVATVVVMLVLGASSHHFHVRPHLATIALFGATVAALVDIEGAARVSAKYAALVPVYVLWTNLHGGVLGGIATLALAGAGFAVFRLLGKASPFATKRDVALSLGVFAGCALSIFVNPYGTAMVRTWLVLSNSEVLRTAIQEHAPLGFETGNDLAIWGFGAVYTALLVGVPFRALRLTWLLPLVWFFLTTRGVRHAPLFALAAGLTLPGVLAECRFIRALVARNPSSLFAPRPPISRFTRPSATVPAVAVAGAFVLQACGVSAGPFGAGWARPDVSVAPLALVPALRDAAARFPDGAGILNELELGGYVIYYAPRLRVVIDDRCELYGDSGIAAYVDAADRHPEAVDGWVRSYDLRLALTTRGSRIDRHIASSPEWARIATSHSANLYERAVSR